MIDCEYRTLNETPHDVHLFRWIESGEEIETIEFSRTGFKETISYLEYLVRRKKKLEEENPFSEYLIASKPYGTDSIKVLVALIKLREE